MGMTSRIYAELIDTYFPNVFFGQITEQSEQDSELPDIEKYAKQTKTKWVLDIQRMSGEKPFCCFFSSDAAGLAMAEWENIDCKLHDKRPKGGLPRPFVEMEDDRFIPLLNKASGHTFERKDDFSIPEDFFTVLENFDIQTFYDDKKKIFIWDFSAIITKFKPDSICNAYQRYAHAEYTRLSLGAKELPLEQDIKKLKLFGNKKILDDLGDRIDWMLVEDALQVFPNKDPYTLSIMDEIKKDVLGQLKRKKRMGREAPIFDHNDEVSISNAWNNLLPFITDMALSEEDKSALNQAGLVMKVRFLYKAVTDDLIEKQIDPRRIKTIEELYRKLQIEVADDPDTFDDKGNGNNPEELLIDKEQREYEYIIRLFDDAFSGSERFLEEVHRFIINESKSNLKYEINRYRKVENNINGALFELFCKVNEIDINAKKARKIHLQFADSMKEIANTLYAYDNGKEKI